MPGMEHLTAQLNPAQKEAVTAKPGHLLILAGAGSGKTRVLVHRIGWLIEAEQVSPFAILAVTFTNKAAHEMQARTEKLVGSAARSMWIGTFHSLAHRLLRMHCRDAGLPEAFQILDSEDQARLVRRTMKNLEIDEDRWPPKQAQWFINAKKDEGLRAKDIQEPYDVSGKTMLRIYRAYEEACQRAGLVDFAELLLRTLELLQNNPSILAHYQQRFEHILVDEFQDTNAIQYRWLKLLAGNNSYVMIVGDDDQSIYSWRGAKVENIRKFQREFADTQSIVLEQNYRSTGMILKAANKLIDNNDDRLGKNLWTETGDGEPIAIYAAFNELDEARFIVSQIQQWIQNGGLRSEVAILYRSNAQSRVLEEALIQQGIAYRIYGGMRFFERAEIKDALSYLRLTTNRHDDPAFERVVNLPVRGIGERTIETLREIGRDHACSLWDATHIAIKEQQLTARAANSLQIFIDLIENLHSETNNTKLDKMTEYVLQYSGLLAHYQQMKGETGQTKVENLGELVSATREFVAEEGDMDDLTAFLSHAALESGETQSDASQDCVQLMTLHSAKGLEFRLVFLAGVEEGLFPHQMSLDEPGRLEEERRLCYVGITRAMQKLFISYAEERRLYGKTLFQSPSRFIKELPKECLRDIRTRTSSAKPTSYAKPSSHYNQTSFAKPSNQRIRFEEETPSHGMRVGQRVHHPKFGEGVITGFEGQGEQGRVQVQFMRAGSKWLVLAYANLTTI